MATVNRDRVNLSQWLDYRIFIISAYHKDELTQDVLDAAASQDLFLTQDIRSTATDNYFFLRYSIDDYVKGINISRTIASSPSSLSLTVFPEHTDPTKPEKDFKFFYKLKNRYTPVFRRWDYIEIQVAELTIPDTSLNTRQLDTKNFTLLLNNQKRAIQYDEEKVGKFYNVRFRGFITDIQEEDSVDGGRTISIQAKSLLHFLSQTPFITNLAIFTDRFTETQRAHLLENQFIVLYGDLLTDLRDATSRANSLLEETFQISSTVETLSTTVQNITGTPLTFKDQNFLGEVKDPQQAFKNLLDKLNIQDIKKAKGTQALLIPLAELFLAQVNNTAETTLLYKIFKSDLFNKEIQFTGQNTEFISDFTYLLSTLADWANSIKYFFYEQANGTLIFDRANFNGNIEIVVEPYKWKSYTYKEAESGYWTEYFVTPGTAFQVFDDSVRQTLFKTSGYTLDQLRRYGYRRPSAETNPNVSTPPALEQYAKTAKAINNAQLRTLDFTIPYDKRIDVGSIVWFQEKNLVGYVTECNEILSYGEEASMSVTLQYLREITNINDISTKKKTSTTATTVTKTQPSTVSKQLKNSKKIIFDPIETINNAVELVRKAGAKKNKTEAQIEIEIQELIAANVQIETFPEYTFVSDFYEGKMQANLQTTITNPQERAAK